MIMVPIFRRDTFPHCQQCQALRHDVIDLLWSFEFLFYPSILIRVSSAVRPSLTRTDIRESTCPKGF
ncbi:hypothetical protein PM082_010573 [Marasmius tenuissimus]|nr:hypothetical protein PM082_010573 [Marasmius tenuissimus]